MIISGNTVGTPMPRTNYEQTNPAKADYLTGKNVLDQKIEAAHTAAGNAQTAVDQHSQNEENPHGVTAEQVGARPSDWMPTAEEVGAVTEEQVTAMINDALGVIENGTY